MAIIQPDDKRSISQARHEIKGPVAVDIGRNQADECSWRYEDLLTPALREAEPNLGRADDRAPVGHTVPVEVDLNLP